MTKRGKGSRPKTQTKNENCVAKLSIKSRTPTPGSTHRQPVSPQPAMEKKLKENRVMVHLAKTPPLERTVRERYVGVKDVVTNDAGISCRVLEYQTRTLHHISLHKENDLREPI